MNYLNLSKSQILILDFIKEQIYLKGYPPSIREICLEVGLKSTSTVHSHLNTLEKLGYIKKDPTKPRAIEVLDKRDYENKPDFVKIPILDNLVQGSYVFDKINIKKYMHFPSDLIKEDNRFILKVKGNSMKNENIIDGDLVIARRQHMAENNQIVVALVHKEYLTVKKLEQDNDIIKLKSENDNIDPIILTKQDVDIVGLVVGVFRNFM